MNQKDLLLLGENNLKRNQVEDAYIKAKKLLEHVLNQSKEELVINSLKEVSRENEQSYESSLEEIIQGKPIQYITKSQEFMGLNFYVDENVLIPQSDTEILVEETLKLIKEKYLDRNIKILDLCTGSGAIAISIAKYIENLDNKTLQKNIKEQIEIYAIDICKKALEIAKKNAKDNDAKINFIQSNMFEALNNLKFDIIVSNPPYIETKTISTLSKEVQSEPIIALDGGQDGLDFYKIINKESPKYLNDDGHILLEIGYNQKESVTKIFEENYKNITCIKDLADNDRVIKIKK